ncbi:DUF4129 domain-containing protein [Kamptonema formosum]|uniref:DUF4129 domain-containing protein n=1 Tax=Kamptonema formosum TaxID=331992 RepID=UPI00034B4D82|nr:DUF4129 domain-containing protein [Oscillatoria sp. PCC 10802]
MSAGSFETTNFGWQLQQLQQQAAEWLELQLSQFHPPQVSWPSLPAGWSWLQPVSWALFWVTLGLLLSWLALRLLRLWPEIWSAFPSLLGNSPKVTPLESPLTPAAWQQQSQEFQRLGNYREACRSLYMAMLQQLHDTGTAQNLPSRTDGEYRHLLRQLRAGEPYEILLLTHERLCFGTAEPAPEDFRRCQQAYRQISQEAKLK